MRGAHSFATAPHLPCGIIPAYAGSTNALCMQPLNHRDHPRVCGEHVVLAFNKAPVSGSSPRMRGALEITCIELIEVGIIPAYAGSTRRNSTSCARRRDHPRVCGEHQGALRSGLRRQGSSPRMRGALYPLVGGVSRRRIIPAYAGSTDNFVSALRYPRDHPRVCGEHMIRSNLHG